MIPIPPGGQAPPRGSPRACLKVDTRSESVARVGAGAVREGRAVSCKQRLHCSSVMGLFGPPRLGV